MLLMGSLADWTQLRKISTLEDRSKETSQFESMQRMKKKKTQHKNTQELGDNSKRCNTCIIVIPEGEQRKKGEEIFEEIKPENFPKLMTDTKSKIQEAHETSSWINGKKSIPRHIAFKPAENQRGNLERSQRGEKHIASRGTRVRSHASKKRRK